MGLIWKQRNSFIQKKREKIRLKNIRKNAKVDVFRIQILTDKQKLYMQHSYVQNKQKYVYKLLYICAVHRGRQTKNEFYQKIFFFVSIKSSAIAQQKK